MPRRKNRRLLNNNKDIGLERSESPFGDFPGSSTPGEIQRNTRET